MNILITGGSGFIGHHLTAYLAGRGHSVSVLDQVHPDKPVENVEYMLGSVKRCKPLLWGKPDVIVHAAAMLGVALTDRAPLATTETNSVGTRHVAMAARALGVKKLVYLSSSEVYGQANRVPTPEDEPLLPYSQYGWSKIGGEIFVRSCGVPYVIVRPFNVYGPGQRPDFVLPKMISAAIEDGNIEYYGKGFSRRSYCYISDFINALGRCIEFDHVRNRIINLGNPAEYYSSRDLAEKVACVLGKGRVIGVPFKDRKPGREIHNRQPDCRQAAQWLDWVPETKIEEGIALTAAAMQPELETNGIS